MHERTLRHLGTQIAHRANATRRATAAKAASTLVVIYGEVRGDAMVWASQYKHLISPLKVDVAFFCGADCERFGAFLQVATHVWRRTEPPSGASWDVLISQRGHEGKQAMEIAANTSVDFAPQAWGLTRARGGLVRSGSGAASMETRQQLLEKLRSSGAAVAYEYFVLTRSDYYYLCDHPSPEVLLPPDARAVAVPYELNFKDSPTYCNDRHAVTRRDGLEAYLGVLSVALRHSTHALWTGGSSSGGRERNIEAFTASSLALGGAHVVRPKLPIFLVRATNDASRWSKGMWLYHRNLSIEQHAAVAREYTTAEPHDSRVEWRARAEAALEPFPDARLSLKQCERLKVYDNEVWGATSACNEAAHLERLARARHPARGIPASAAPSAEAPPRPRDRAAGSGPARGGAGRAGRRGAGGAGRVDVS